MKRRLEDKGKEKEKCELCEEDFVCKLESYSQFRHPQPFFLFFWQGELVNIMRKASQPLLFKILREILHPGEGSEVKPNPDMHAGEIVVGHDAMWDPEKERLELEKQRCETLEKCLVPIVLQYFWRFTADDTVQDTKVVREFCLLFTVGDTEEKQDEARKHFGDLIHSGKSLALCVQDLVHQTEHIIDPNVHLRKLQEFAAGIDVETKRKERMEMLKQMMFIHVKSSDETKKITKQQADAFQNVCKEYFESEQYLEVSAAVADKTVIDAASSLMTLFTSKLIFNVICHRMDSIFLNNRLTKSLEAYIGALEQEDPSAPMAEHGKQVFFAFNGEGYQLPEDNQDLLNLPAQEFIAKVNEENLIPEENLNKHPVALAESHFKSFINTELMIKLFSKFISKNAFTSLKNGTLLVSESLRGSSLAFALHLCSLCPQIVNFELHVQAAAKLQTFFNFHPKQVREVTFTTPQTDEFCQVLNQQERLVSFVFCGAQEEFSAMFGAFSSDNARKLLCKKNEEAPEVLQNALGQFMKNHKISDYNCQWILTKETNDAIFSNYETMNEIKLHNVLQFQSLFTSKMLLKNSITLQAETLFSEELFKTFLAYLTAHEKLMKAIDFHGHCDITEEQWIGFFELIKSKSGVEKLSIVDTDIRSMPQLFELINEKPNIGEFVFSGKSIEVKEVETFLQTLSPERKFDLHCDFGDLSQKEDFSVIAQEYATKYDWLVIENLVESTISNDIKQDV